MLALPGISLVQLSVLCRTPSVNKALSSCTTSRIAWRHPCRVTSERHIVVADQDLAPSPLSPAGNGMTGRHLQSRNDFGLIGAP